MSHYVSLDQFQEMQSEFNITGNESEKMIRFCHRMGMILHWSKVSALKRTVVLNPQFIINAAARIMHESVHHYRIVEERLKENPGLRIAYEESQSTGFISNELLCDILWGGQALQVENKILANTIRSIIATVCAYQK